MKQLSILLVGLILTFFWSCKESHENSIIEISTKIELEIELVAEMSNQIPLKAVQIEENYTFYGSGSFCLANNEELGNLVCDIQNVRSGSGCMLSISGMEQGNTINTLQLIWDSKTPDETDFDMQNTIDITSLLPLPENGVIEINLTEVLHPLVNCIDNNPDCMYRLDIQGTSNFELTSMAKLKIPLVVENKLYPVKFTLF